MSSVLLFFVLNFANALLERVSNFLGVNIISELDVRTGLITGFNAAIDSRASRSLVVDHTQRSACR